MRTRTREVSGRLTSFLTRAEDYLATGRYRNHYVYKRGSRRVLIDELVSPLRYDIWVRISFFRFYAERKGMFDRDFDLFVSASLAHPYFVWFKEINCRKFHPDLLMNDQTLHAAFSHRVRQSALLYTRVQAQGFEKKRPILLYSCERLNQTATGKLVDRAFYMGDGCHRLALLKLSGHKWLEPEKYVFRSFPALSPLDNTADLLKELRLPTNEYFKFLSSGYGGADYERKEALLNHVLKNQTDRYDEVLEVISRDEKASGILASVPYNATDTP